MTLWLGGVGALMVLAAYIQVVRGTWPVHAVAALRLNAVGSALLAASAAGAGQWHFVVLNAIWCAAATRALIS